MYRIVKMIMLVEGDSDEISGKYLWWLDNNQDRY